MVCILPGFKRGMLSWEGDKCNKMARKAPSLALNERGGDKYPSLAAAQRAALPFLAADLAASIRELLATDALILVNGRIIPNPERRKKNV